MRALRRMKPNDAKDRDKIRRELGYFGDNRAMMQYPKFRKRGLMIGSGPVEAACKSVVEVRFKRAGMRWATAGIQPLLALRAMVVSYDYQTLIPYAIAA